jgi:hypothetical protein
VAWTAARAMRTRERLAVLPQPQAETPVSKAGCEDRAAGAARLAGPGPARPGLHGAARRQLGPCDGSQPCAARALHADLQHGSTISGFKTDGRQRRQRNPLAADTPDGGRPEKPVRSDSANADDSLSPADVMMRPGELVGGGGCRRSTADWARRGSAIMDSHSSAWCSRARGDRPPGPGPPLPGRGQQAGGRGQAPGPRTAALRAATTPMPAPTSCSSLCRQLPVCSTLQARGLAGTPRSGSTPTTGGYAPGHGSPATRPPPCRSPSEGPEDQAGGDQDSAQP